MIELRRLSHMLIAVVMFLLVSLSLLFQPRLPYGIPMLLMLGAVAVIEAIIGRSRPAPQRFDIWYLPAIACLVFFYFFCLLVLQIVTD